MRKNILICILQAIPFMFANAQTGTLPVLDFNADTRSAGMGESTMGESKGMYLYANPTSFLLEGKKIYGTYTYGLFPGTDDNGRLHFHAASAGYRLKKQAFMVGFRGWHGLKIAKVGEDGVEKKDIKPIDMSVDITYARLLGNHLSAYITGSYIYSDLGKSSSTVAGGAGLYYRNFISPAKEEWAYCIGAAIRNLGGKVKYEKTSYDLPTSVDLGGSLGIPVATGHKVDATFSARYLMLPSDAKTWSGGFGAEYELLELIAFRAGYHFGRSNNYATFGLGGKIKQVNVDIAYRAAGSDDIGNGSKWRFGIGVLF